MATAGSIIIDLLLRTGSFETDSKRAEKRVKDFRKEVTTSMIAAGNVIGDFVTDGIRGLANFTVETIKFADQLDEMSQRLGISTETLSGWGYVAKLSGTDLESLTSAIPKLSKTLAAAADESSKAGQLFKAMGIDVKDAEGSLRDIEDVLPEIADRFKALKNDTLEQALAQELLGRSGAQLLEFFNRGSDGIAELTDRAKDLGLIVSGETASAAASFNDKLEELRAVTTAFGLQIAELLLPSLERLVEWLIQNQREGKLLGFEIEDLGGAVDYFAGELSKADSIGESFKISLQGMIEQVVAFGDILGAVAGRDWQQFKAAFGNYFDARAKTMGAALAGAPGRQQRAVIFSDEQRIPSSMLSDRNLPDPTPRINHLLGGGKDGSGKSQAEKDAESLQRSYESLLDQQRERIALFGTEGEVAQLTYDITHGALKGLTEDQKKLLLENAEWIDFQREAADIEKVWADGTQDRIDAQYRGQKAFDDMMKTLQEETELLSLNADEQEIWNNLKWAGVTAESDLGKAIIESTRSLQAQRTAMEDQIDIMDGIRDAGRGLFDDVRNGVGVWDALGNAIDRAVDALTDVALENVLDQLFGKQGEKGGGSWGAAIGEIFGAMFGGSRAGGGDALGWRPILVGEQGPELFMPRTTGRVLNAEQTAGLLGGGGSNVNQYNTFAFQAPTSARTQTQVANRTGYELRRAARLGGGG